MEDLQHALHHTSLAPPRPRQPSLIASFPSELIIQIRNLTLALSQASNQAADP